MTGETEKKPEHKLPKLTDQQVKDLALEVYRGGVYLHDTEEKIRIGALPLALGALKGWTEDEVNNIGMIISREKDWAPRSCNGIPMAFKIGLIHRESGLKVVEQYKLIKAAVDGAQAPA